jgi:hypothetical protein
VDRDPEAGCATMSGLNLKSVKSVDDPIVVTARDQADGIGVPPLALDV